MTDFEAIIAANYTDTQLLTATERETKAAFDSQEFGNLARYAGYMLRRDALGDDCG